MLHLSSFECRSFWQITAGATHGEPGGHIGQQSGGGAEHPPQLCVRQQERHCHQHTPER